MENELNTGNVPAASENVTGVDTAEFLVVVTGGSRGIGCSCVHAFAKRGCHVLFSYNTT